MDVINTETAMIETVDAVQVFKKYFDEYKDNRYRFHP